MGCHMWESRWFESTRGHDAQWWDFFFVEIRFVQYFQARVDIREFRDVYGRQSVEKRTYDSNSRTGPCPHCPNNASNAHTPRGGEMRGYVLVEQPNNVRRAHVKRCLGLTPRGHSLVQV
jgi:hypothetical protein